MRFFRDAERRIFPRVKADVRCWVERESVTLMGTVTNLCAGGLFLRTPITVGEGAKVSLQINMGSGVVNASGYVAWTVSPNNSSPYSGVGICFNRITKGKKLLSTFIDERVSTKSDETKETE